MSEPRKPPVPMALEVFKHGRDNARGPVVLIGCRNGFWYSVSFDSEEMATEAAAVAVKNDMQFSVFTIARVVETIEL